MAMEALVLSGVSEPQLCGDSSLTYCNPVELGEQSGPLLLSASASASALHNKPDVLLGGFERQPLGLHHPPPPPSIHSEWRLSFTESL